MNLGKKIVEIRKDNKMSQDDFAEVLNVTRQTVSNWENSKNYPDIETLIKISNQFDISLDILLKGDKDMVNKLDKDIKKSKVLKVITIAFVLLLIITLIIFTVSRQRKSVQEKRDKEKYENIISNMNQLGFERDEIGFATITENGIIYRIFVKIPSDVINKEISASSTIFTDDEAIVATFNGKDIKVTYVNEDNITVYCNKDGSLLNENQNKNYTNIYHKYQKRTIEVVTRMVELFDELYH